MILSIILASEPHNLAKITLDNIWKQFSCFQTHVITWPSSGGSWWIGSYNRDMSDNIRRVWDNNHHRGYMEHLSVYVVHYCGYMGHHCWYVGHLWGIWDSIQSMWDTMGGMWNNIVGMCYTISLIYQQREFGYLE